MSNRVDGGYKVCCDSYRGRLRTIKVFWWLHGLVGCLVGLGHMDLGADLGPQGCCGGYRDRMKTTKVPFVATVIGLGHII